MRTGEIHPILTKLESRFFPRRNRVTRSEYFTCVLVFGFLGIILYFLGYLIDGLSDSPAPLSTNAATLLLTLKVVDWSYQIFATYISTRVAYYRFHDLNCDGNIAYYYLAVMLGLRYTYEYHPDIIKENTYVMIALIIVYLIIQIALWFVPGTKGPNKYGDQPK